MPVIFISYRRSDSQDVAGRIYDRLVSKFEKKRVFKDVDNIPLGVSFPLHLQQMIGKTGLALVIIGPGWLTATDEQGRRRLDDPNDFVRVEVESALRAGIPVVPVLVSHAVMPKASELPKSMQKLVERHGMAVRPDPDFNNDIRRLFSGIEHLERLRNPERDKPRTTPPVPDPSPPHRAYGLFGLLGLLALVAIGTAFVVWRSSQGDGTNNKKIEATKNRKIEPTYENTLGMKFAWIPPGPFQMGSPQKELLRDTNETQHKVTLTKGFYMGIHPVTQEQWQAVVGSNPSSFKGEKNLPVEKVSWNDCQDFIKKLRSKDSKAYRLPTEAEWEYGCRAGTTTPFYFGQTISTDQANYDGFEVYGNGTKGVSRGKTTPVGSFPRNDLGLFDMHGNVAQWCQDWFGDYPQNDVVDPQGPSEGQDKVLRGGSWISLPGNCRAACRLRSEPGLRVDVIGFRLCFCLD